MNNFFSQDARELIMAVLVLVLIVSVVNPGHVWMPDMFAMTLAVLLLIVFGVFAIFVWRERAADEREQLHKLMVGHAAFLVGATVLTLGLLFQSMSHRVDAWVALALGTMMLTKIVSIVWTRKKQ